MMTVSRTAVCTPRVQQHTSIPPPCRLRAATILEDDAVAASPAAIAGVVTTPPLSSESGGSSNTENSLSSSVVAATRTATTKTKSWSDDGFVFGLDGSGLERPRGRQAVTYVDGDSLETQSYQVAMVVVTMVGHAVLAAVSLLGMVDLNDGSVLFTAGQAIALALSAWILADFGSGVLHWSVDNYGNGRTPVMGSIIAAFQGHHTVPWTITERGFCNNVHKLCIPFGIVPVAVINAISGPHVTFFITVFCVFEILSQEFHKWSHQLRSESPAIANVLQDAGLTIARKPHAQHHLAPFEGNYCIISGVCNSLLDETGFFRRLERVVYSINRVEPNAWKLDVDLRERTLAGDYSLPKSVRRR
jgi:palmitoyl-[glycerolipid] 3-(E)-desaturase